MSSGVYINLRNVRFLQVCREWETTALRVNKNVRLTLIRIGVVLGKEGGALGKFYTFSPFHLFKFHFHVHVERFT